MLALALTASLTGCATESTCVDWVSYATPQDAYDDATLVVVGTVAGAPVTCSAETSSDPLETDERVVILLINDGGTWRTLTPSAGVLPAPAGEPLPVDVG